MVPAIRLLPPTIVIPPTPAAPGAGSDGAPDIQVALNCKTESRRETECVRMCLRDGCMWSSASSIQHPSIHQVSSPHPLFHPIPNAPYPLTDGVC